MSAQATSLRPQQVEPRSLGELAAFLGAAPPAGSDAALPISGVTLASNAVLPGDVFFALPGVKVHGAKYAATAVTAGATAIVTDAAGATSLKQLGVPVLVIAEPRAQLGRTASWVYRSADANLEIFGVTGTNGKTSVVYLLAAVLDQLGVSAGLSSTAERRFPGHVEVSALTTPEASDVHALLARMAEAGVHSVAMEVSAHATAHHRVDAVHFAAVGFTNFSQDHLDDFGSMEQYFAAKRALFTPEYADRGVIVIDDDGGEQLAQQAPIPVVTISAKGAAADWHVRVTQVTAMSTRFELTGPQDEQLSTTVPVVGDYMATNAALAIVMLVSAGHPFESIAAVLQRDGGINAYIPGRTEMVSGESGPAFYVDYGHTTEAFRSTLAALRTVTPGKLIMVFGADGDRDSTKRQAMGCAAAEGADVVIVTDFHPRSEDPAAIRATLLEGARGAKSSADIREIASQQEAVRAAIAMAGAGDTILYAGPGHENYREVNGEKIPYDARADVRSALSDAGFPPRAAAGQGGSR